MEASGELVKGSSMERSEVWKREDRMEERAWESDGSSVSFAVQES